MGTEQGQDCGDGCVTWLTSLPDQRCRPEIICTTDLSLGTRSIELLADKVILGKNPANVMDSSPWPAVTKDGVAQYEQNWKKWLRHQ